MLAKDHSPYRNSALEKTVDERDAAKKELVARIEQVAQLSADLRGYRERAHETTNRINRLQEQNRRLVEALRECQVVLTKRGMPSQHDLLGMNSAIAALLRELGGE